MTVQRKVERPLPQPEKKTVEVNRHTDRSTQVRRDDDTVGDFIIGLYQNDEAIKYYFDNVINPRVTENGESLAVPTMFGSPERWTSIKRNGYLRDKNKRLLAPLIMYRRTGMEKRRDLSRNIDAQNQHVFQVFKSEYNQRNLYNSFTAMMGKVGEKNIYNVVVPDYFRLSYEFIVWTDKVTQMNKLLEAISYAESAYWGNDRFKFYAVINSFSPTVEVQAGEDRIIKTTFELSFYGYVISDALQKEIKQKSQKAFSISKIKFDIATIDQFSFGVGSERREVIYSDIICGNIYNYSYEVLTYLSTDITKTASLLTNSSAIFTDSSFAVSPSSLPSTSIRDFDFYMNGQYLNQDDLEFSENGDDLVMTFKVGAVEYSINPETDEIVAVGKFAE